MIYGEEGFFFVYDYDGTSTLITHPDGSTENYYRFPDRSFSAINGSGIPTEQTFAYSTTNGQLAVKNNFTAGEFVKAANGNSKSSLVNAYGNFVCSNRGSQTCVENIRSPQSYAA